MSMLNRQQTAPVAFASIAGLLVLAGAKALLGTTGPRLLEAPEPTEKEPYPWNLYEGGATLKTPYGKLRLYELGPKDGRKVLLVHGISLPSPLWRRVIPHLVATGHRVLCYDLVARGYSDGPAHLEYDSSLYVSQICMLLTSLPDWNGNFDIVGYSLGGMIATTFASFFPHRIDNLLLMAPVGFAESKKMSFFQRLFFLGKIPFTFAKSLVDTGLGPIKLMRSSSLVSWQLDNHQGLVHAFVSSLINNNIVDLQDQYLEVHEQFGDRMQIIWGDKDIVCPIEGAKSVPGIKVHVIEGAGHDMALQPDFSDKVADLMDKCLSS